MGKAAIGVALGFGASCSSTSTPDGAGTPDGDAAPEAGPPLTLQVATTTLTIDPAEGARIVSLRAGADELLSGSQVNAISFGSTFWPSPQSAWRLQQWPPPPAIDSEAYAGGLSGNVIMLSGGVDPDTHLGITKKITANSAKQAIDIEYTMTNQGAATASWAPWEVTRLPGNGLTFWPTGGAPFKGAQALLPSQDAAGHTWVDATTAPMLGAKLYADGSGGWLAQVAGDAILIKQFTDQPASAAAPGEAEIELYLSPRHEYVEVEPQGPYTAMAAGASATWKVTWYVRKLPAGLTPSVGNTDLIAFVMQTVQ